MQALAPQHAQQGMPGRMEFDRVDAVADAVEGIQFGLVAIRQLGQLPAFLAAELGAVARQRICMPLALQALYAALQNGVIQVKIVAIQFSNLVGYFVGLPLHVWSPDMLQYCRGSLDCTPCGDVRIAALLQLFRACVQPRGGLQAGCARRRSPALPAWQV